jgi:alanine racemase
MAEAPIAALRLECDGDALAANWRALDRLSGAAAAGAAVKADAYGTGARRAAAILRGAGCRDFFVAHSSEAAELADLLPPAAIAVLHGPLNLADARFIKAIGARPVINSLHQAALWREAGGGRCDLMVDTGINRLGLPPAQIGDPAIGGLDIDICHSHLACADEDVPRNGEQLARWNAACQHLSPRRRSLANSAGIALGSAYHGDLTRPGLSLYGGVQRAELAPHIRQVVRPAAAIMQVRTIEPGDAVGYNATYIASRRMRIGVISIGYADGYLTAWSNKGVFRCGEAALPVLGKVSMDMTIIDLAQAPDLAEGDWVHADYDLREAAARSGLGQYELLTLMGRRLAR